MTHDELLTCDEMEAYSLLYGYSVVYDRTIDKNVLEKCNRDYVVRDNVDLDQLARIIGELPNTDVLSLFLEEIKDPEEGPDCGEDEFI